MEREEDGLSCSSAVEMSAGERRRDGEGGTVERGRGGERSRRGGASERGRGALSRR